MQKFGKADLEGLLSDLTPQHYSYFNTLPLAAVIYEDTIQQIRKSPGVVDFTILQKIARQRNDRTDEGRITVFPPAASTFVYNGRLVTLQFTEYKTGESENYQRFDQGVVVTSANPDAEKMVLDNVLEAVAKYDSESIWKEAVRRKLCKETAKQFEERTTKWEEGREYKFVHVFRADEKNPYRCVWTFDGKEFLWGSMEGGSSIPSTLPATLLLSIGNLPTGFENRIEPFISAESTRPILDRHYHQAGLKNNSCQAGIYQRSVMAFYADQTRETALLTTFDSLTAIMPLKIIKDGRKR